MGKGRKKKTIKMKRKVGQRKKKAQERAGRAKAKKQPGI